MENRPASPTQEYSSPKTESDERTPVVQSQEDQIDRESSSSDVPLRQQRPRRAPTRERKDSTDLQGHLRLQSHVHDSNNTSLLEERRAEHKATLRSPAKAAPKSCGKVLKKPGPRPWASKPIMKNDMAAKKEVIREIEVYWGKGFIKAYIPKCHRPLVKRGKRGKRVMYRDHESDPKKWLPSVLKAVLMIARLTNKKAWLKKAMNDVVRYRIKNTGNRKPQLVTTDFDVIEDLLVKDWDVAYSFEIRYKHLLVNRQGQQETDEDIDHILAVDSGQEDVSNNENDIESDHSNDDNDDDVEDVDESDDEKGRGGLTSRYLHASGYTNGPQNSHPYFAPGPLPKHQKTKQDKSPGRMPELPSRPQPPSVNKGNQQGYGQPYPYGPPVNQWGQPMPYAGYGGYGGYGMYGGYGDYGPPQEHNARHPSQPPGFPEMNQYPPFGHAITPAPGQPGNDRADGRRVEASPFSGHRRTQGGIEQSSFNMSRPGFMPYRYPQNIQGSEPEVKQESTEFERREMSTDEIEDPTDDVGEDDNAAAVEAELRATELELKVARLQARRAAMNQQSKAK
ncbi:hypothetical protein ST47_g1579 [Ascochyta rabiei]|uniref:Uncharacterized protein n=1 Tax=Didymella rabiei TaxID=5454 RepID=A0A163KUU5_DIDRA|nr:hypothetical protein ST47_g1579 [Ascochyta rabiei]